MDVPFSAVIVSDDSEIENVFNTVLREEGFQSIVMLARPEAIPQALLAMTDPPDALAICHQQCSEASDRQALMNSLGLVSFPVIFLLEEASILTALNNAEIFDSSYNILPKRISRIALRVLIQSLRGMRAQGTELGDHTFHDLFLNHSDATIIHRLDGAILTANLQARKLLELEDSEVQESYLGSFESEDFTSVFSELTALAQRQGVAFMELVLNTATKKTFAAEVYTGKINSRRDEYFTVLRDISQLRIIKEKFKHRLSMEGSVNSIATLFLAGKEPRRTMLEALEQIGIVCGADSVWVEFSRSEAGLFEDSRLFWFNRRKLSSDIVVDIPSDLRDEILAELSAREYVYSESWRGEVIPRILALPIRIDGQVFASIWIQSSESPMSYEDRMLLLMIGDLFRSYIVQQIQARDSIRTIASLRLRNRHLHCVSAIQTILREEGQSVFQNLCRASEVLFDNLEDSESSYLEIRLLQKTHRVGDTSSGSSENHFAENDALFFRELQQYGFSLGFYHLESKRLSVFNDELLNAVFAGISQTLELQQRVFRQNFDDVQIQHRQRIEAMGQLAAGIAHEMNTPNQYIQDNLQFVSESFSQVLPVFTRMFQALSDCDSQLRGLGHQQIRSMLENVKSIDLPFLSQEIPIAIEQSLEGVRRQRTLIDSMRRSAHPDGTRERLQVPVNNIIDEALSFCRFELSNVAVVETRLSPENPSIFCNPQEISQVLINLLVNAAHAIEERSNISGGADFTGKLVIYTRSGDGLVEIRVVDNGPGIAADLQGRIFEPFFTTKAVGKGSGQGLAIAYEIIENRHNGQIMLRSKPMEGCEFRLLLPKEPNNMVISPS